MQKEKATSFEQKIGKIEYLYLQLSMLFLILYYTCIRVREDRLDKNHSGVFTKSSLFDFLFASLSYETLSLKRQILFL